MRPRLLDLFCGAGGATKGYQRAGFDVVGVDINPQPDYCGDWSWQGDALEALRIHAPFMGRDFAAIHASPPCQAYTALQKGANAKRGFEHPELYEAVRTALEATGLPYVIENPAARADVVLCGEMFGLGVLRHRRFELGGWSMEQPAHVKHRGRVRGWRHGTYYDGPYVAVYGAGGDRRQSRGPGGGKANIAEAKAAMGIDWTESLYSVTEAIPPAYTECVGAALLKSLDARKAA